MSHEHGHESAAPFTAAEVESLQADDRKAAANIVILLTGVFTLGLFGYLIVAFWIGGQ